jgi:hypothetical protein
MENETLTGELEMSEQLQDAALNIYDAIFGGRESVEIDGATYQVERTSKSNLLSVRIDPLFFVEQNPSKSSKWAELAREGHQIMWVMRGRSYLARVMDGKFLDLRRKPKS